MTGEASLIGVIFFGHLHTAAPASFQTIEPQLHAQLTASNVPTQVQDQIVNGVEQCFVDMSGAKDQSVTPESCKKAQSASADQALTNSVSRLAKQADATNFAKAFRAGTIFEIGLLTATFILSWFLPKKIRAEALAEAF